jgi:hypothetical protein
MEDTPSVSLEDRREWRCTVRIEAARRLDAIT